MNWEKVKLNDICSSIYDGDHNAPPKSDTGVPFVTISNIDAADGSIDFSNTAHVPNSYFESLKPERRPRPGDVLYSVVGSFGIPSLVKDQKPFVFQRHVAILRPNDRIEPEYLYYSMKSRNFYHWADSVAIGAAQRTVTLGQLREKTIALPPLPVQSRIAGVLSTYDKLIENNRRQIKLLEEAAQRLYKEWFVDLRFPGHETTPIVDGLPEEWERGELGSVVEFRRGKTITRKETVEGGVPVVAGGLEPAYYHNAANTGSPVITVSGSGANAGFCRLYVTKVWASDCSFADANMTEDLIFVYLTIKVLSNGFKQCQRGSAQPHVYPKHVNDLQVLIPNVETLECFRQLVAPFFIQIGILEQQIVAAREARDRLLPKLMSGEIEV
ncbi:restriction endonuclease subunit S [Ellagibacter isourolithinifaciens]|uniref:restriction endonuclease subunit S n=1 Tax=Ellagibacter isourolithinifaciens TaxID=2137581 RepID=UPI003AAC94A8